MKVEPAQVKGIFLHAVENCAPGEWGAYLDQACGENQELRRRVMVLLEAHQIADSLIDPPEPTAPLGLASSESHQLGAVIGPYKLLQPIGEGGMGTVYMAEQTQPVRRTVALKLIKAGMDSRQVLARFGAERQALALMDHPNIAKIFDAGTTDNGRPYFVMELVKGIPITRFCDERRLTLRERLELAIPVCQAVQHAHQKGIIHRDLKPSNVLIALYDGKPVPKVIDFGVAKATGPRLTDQTLYTEFGAVVGTLEYMSPEQAELNQLDIDTRSDIYSLGVLLYELLTGTTPLDRKRLKAVAILELLRVIREEESPRPSTRLSTTEELPSIAACRNIEPRKLGGLMRGELDWIVMKALEKDRNRRYETANGLAADLRRYLDDEPVEACPPSAWYRFRKFARRNKRPVVASAVVLLVLIIGIIGTTWGFVRAVRARLAEAEQRALAEGNERRALAAVAAENEAKERAQEREAETMAVLEFVEEKIFAAARPEGQEGGVGRDVTLRAALEAALPFVEKSFANQPLIEARLRSTLGQSYIRLGLSQVAAEQFERARVLYTQRRGPDHPDTLSSMVSLATSYNLLGRSADALRLNEQALELQKAKLGPDHPDTLSSMLSLAIIYSDLGRSADSLRLNEQNLELQKAKLGPDHPDTLVTMNNLAVVYADLGRHADAIKLLEVTMALSKAKFGPDNPSSIDSMQNLARSYAALDRASEALKLYEQALALRKVKLGPDHPDTLSSMANLALHFFLMDRHAEAIELCEHALTLAKAKLGPDHPQTLKTMAGLARIYTEVGRHAEALKLYDQTLDPRKAKLGLDHRDTLLSMEGLAFSYTALGRSADALKLSEQTVELQKAKLGPDHPDTLRSMHNLAARYNAVGRSAEALRLFEQALALRKVKLGPDDPDTLMSMCGVAQSLGKLNRDAEAMPIIDDFLRRAAGKVIDLRFNAEVLDVRLRHFAKAKDAAGCRATAEMMEKLKLTDADSLYNAACFYAVVAAVLRANDQAEASTKAGAAEADRAMGWLKQAVAAGYKNTVHMAQDQDLDPLRDREDFKKLVAELQARHGKEKKD